MNELMSEQIGIIAAALSKAQLAIENVSKDKQDYGYKYADLASCLQSIKKPLGDNGLSLSQLITIEGDKHVLVTLLMHESGQWLKSLLSIESVVMKQCNSLQQIGAGLTYARRYALCAITGLTQEDDDAMSLPKMKEAEKIQPKQLTKQQKQKVNELIDLCNKSGISVKEFAQAYNMDSADINAVDSAINNFEILKEEFIHRNNINITDEAA